MENVFISCFIINALNSSPIIVHGEEHISLVECQTSIKNETISLSEELTSEGVKVRNIKAFCKRAKYSTKK